MTEDEQQQLDDEIVDHDREAQLPALADTTIADLDEQRQSEMADTEEQIERQMADLERELLTPVKPADDG